VRAIAIDHQRRQVAEALTSLPAPKRAAGGLSEQDPQRWWQAVIEVLQQLAEQLQGYEIRALAVDGTSSTLLLTDLAGQPLTPALMYDDSRSRALLATLCQVTPAASPVHNASSSLAKLLWLKNQLGDQAFLASHQADWILGKLSGNFGISDDNNCLKLGFDPIARIWPAWLSRLDLPRACLPEVHPPGTLVGRLSDTAAHQTRLPGCIRLVTGTTDSNAATLAAGAQQIGDAVTSLGSTLVLKVLSERPVNAPEYGVYSHRLGQRWLVGGASNSGGAVIAAHFSPAEIRYLTTQLKPEHPTGLAYYPLLQPGERFPINDPDYPPRFHPNANNRLDFFQGILEGIALIENRGYELLYQLGAPHPGRVISIGGGANNEPWRRMRERLLGVPVCRAEHTQAAYGTALLALQACTSDSNRSHSNRL
jgi:sugar (pentulose or hexulose) kinase